VAEQSAERLCRPDVGLGIERDLALYDAAQAGGNAHLVAQLGISRGEYPGLERVGHGLEEPSGVGLVLHVASLPQRPAPRLVSSPCAPPHPMLRSLPTR